MTQVIICFCSGATTDSTTEVTSEATTEQTSIFTTDMTSGRLLLWLTLLVCYFFCNHSRNSVKELLPCFVSVAAHAFSFLRLKLLYFLSVYITPLKYTSYSQIEEASQAQLLRHYSQVLWVICRDGLFFCSWLLNIFSIVMSFDLVPIVSPVKKV